MASPLEFPPAEPIAVVGMSCRLPGGASSTSKLWELLTDGRSGQCEIPKLRFDANAFYNRDAAKAGTINGTGGYFLEEDFRLFDNAFFGINNLEAKYMDPQQRQLLEVVFECLETAGTTLEEVSGANIGCYVANFTSDFVIMQAKSPELYHSYSATGFGPTILANRISHCFNLRGPSLVLDTACSSSLYAIHVACTALNAGECDAAIVAGANLVQSPETYVAMTKAGVLSGTSVSHTFDSSADGYGRGEGVGALFLKRLRSSIQNDDPIRSVIRGTAVNSNGHTPGISMPSVRGQEDVIRKAYGAAKLHTHDTTYVEAHGTGTPVGDPIEVEALANAFQPKSTKPLLIGSSKTNLGHGEAISGVSSIIKATLALENQLIPPTIGIQRMNPDLKLEQRNIKVVTELTPWPSNAFKRVSINSFGYGGANAHVIIDSADMHIAKNNGQKKDNRSSPLAANSRFRSFLLPVSANTTESLTRLIENILSHDFGSDKLSDVAYTLGSRRSNLPIRGYVIATESALNPQFSSNSHAPTIEESQMAFSFLFTGQGAQWQGMGLELLTRFHIFDQSIQELDAYLANLPHSPPWSIRETILQNAQSTTLHSASRSQPVCTAVQIALVELLSSWNISASAVVGHSSGEICAAFTAGFITAKQAIAVAYYRGLAVSKLETKGRMIAVGLGQDALNQIISSFDLQRDVRIACHNSPESTTASGELTAIDGLFSVLQDRGIFVRKLQTDNKAYHSHLMECIGDQYEKFLLPMFSAEENELPGRKDVAMFSSVTTKLAEKNIVATPTYWRMNLESPVDFNGAMKLLLSSDSYHMIEIGPHPVLRQPIRDIQRHLNSVKSSYSPTFSRGDHCEMSMMKLAGSLYLKGIKLPFSTLNELSLAETVSGSSSDVRGIRSKFQAQVVTNLPTYPWDHSSLLWTEPRISSEFRNLSYKKHDLLGSMAPGTPGEAIWWRNLLRVKEVPWLQDHRLGQTIVFPAAGYLSMAIQGFLQVHDFKVAEVLTLRQVSLTNLLTLDPAKEGVEICMQMRPAKLSDLNSSGIWWQFEISSHTANNPTVHASGVIGMNRTLGAVGKRLFFKEEFMEKQATRTWYNRLAKEGLCFGEEFRSLDNIRTDGGKKLPCAIANTVFRGQAMQKDSEYIMHPIVIDSLLQAAIVASSKGVVQALHGKVPVTIGQLDLLSNPSTPSAELCTIRSTSQKTGFGTVILGGELENGRGNIIVQVQGVRAVAYPVAFRANSNDLERNPTLRILWKPDISIDSNRDPEIFSTYLERFESSFPHEHAGSGLAFFAGAVDLVTHKNGRMNILELDDADSGLEDFLNQTSIGRDQQHFQTYTTATITATGEIARRDKLGGARTSNTHSELQILRPENTIDLVLLPSSAPARRILGSHFESLTPYLAQNAIFIFASDRVQGFDLDKNQYVALSATPKSSKLSFTIASPSVQTKATQTSNKPQVVLVYLNAMHTLNKGLQHLLSKHFETELELRHLDEISADKIPHNAIVVTTIELEDPILANITPNQLDAVKTMAEKASILLWITGGRLFKSQRPEFSLILGLARSLMLEKPSLKMPVLDLDNGISSEKVSIEHAVSVLDKVMGSTKPDLEYRQYKDILYNSRFVPDVSLNGRFQQVQNKDILRLPVADAGHCNIAMGTVGQLDTIHFKEIEHYPKVEAGYIEIRVDSVGINAKDFYALSDKIDIRNSTSSLEMSGVVVKAGSPNSNFVPGDRVVAMSPSKFGTTECVPEWACCKLKDEEDLTVMSTIPLAFSTALYALENRASLQKDQSVLIHSAAGGIGIAAVQISQLIGAEIFATVGTEEKKRFLIESFDIREDHIFSSHDATFLPRILEATSGKGVDVVLNSLTGDLLRESWRACAEFGTFVEIGKRDISEGGILDMGIFSRATTFTAFDLTDIYWSKSELKRQIWHRLLYQSIELFRAGKIKPITPLKVFPASDIVQAFRYFSLSTRMGKVAVSFSLSSHIPVIPNPYNTFFSPNKTYILVGCLGGLGRSLSLWMFQRGARSFVFLGRSGTDKPAAAKVVKNLRESGAQVIVIRGDVASYGDVERAVQVSEYPIGGVVQAAMSIHVALFNDMPCDTWHIGTNQKVKGAWNLHNALRGHDNQLDFFLMLSSITGSVGTATESNYCAANSFLDSFGCYRRSLGLPGLSIGLGMISEVGFLHENPETESVLLRKGVHPFTEEELLQIIDISLTPPMIDSASATDGIFGADHYMQGHILTGLELHGFQKIRDAGFVRGTTVLEDRRCEFIAGAFANSADRDYGNGTDIGKRYPSAVAKALEANQSNSLPDDELVEAVTTVVADRIATLLLVSPTQLQKDTHLAEFGMESMLAAEFRSDIFRAFKTDVPFVVLMDKSTKVKTVAEFIGKELLRYL